MADARHPPPRDAPQVHPTYLRLLRMLLRALQLDADALLARCGLSWERLSVEDQRLDYATVERVIQEALQAAQRPWIGLELGAGMQVASHGLPGHAAMAARDLRQALQAVVSYVGLRLDLFHWRLVDEPGGARLVVSERYALGASRDFIVDVVFAALLKLVDAVTGQRPSTLAAQLPFDAPPWVGRYDSLGVRDLRFGQPHLALRLDDALLDQPCVSADATAYAAAVRACEEDLHARATGQSWASRLQGLLKARTDETVPYPTLSQAAAQLQLSPRTLMRRLQREGSSFQRELDEARKAQALWYLRQTHQPVEEIAARLGYLDTSNFSRTVRRWFGASPQELRREAGTTARP